MTRKEIAEKMGMSYTLLSNKINGFAEWQAGEKKLYNQLLNKEEETVGKTN